MFQEKRKFKRFKGKERAFAAFLNPNELISTGPILDISMGGLCFRCLATKKCNGEDIAIKIFGSNGRFIHLDRASCRIVYDHELPEGSWEQIGISRYGVEFENLSAQHQCILEEFIDHFAFDETEGGNDTLPTPGAHY